MDKGVCTQSRTGGVFTEKEGVATLPLYGDSLESASSCTMFVQSAPAATAAEEGGSIGVTIADTFPFSTAADWVIAVSIHATVYLDGLRWYVRQLSCSVWPYRCSSMRFHSGTNKRATSIRFTATVYGTTRMACRRAQILNTNEIDERIKSTSSVIELARPRKFESERKNG